MAASITRGTTFTEGQQNVTVATFTPLLTAATIAGVDRESVDATVTVATLGTTPPDNPQDQEAWQDSGNAIHTVLSDVNLPGTSNQDKFTVPVGGTAVSAGMVICPEGSVDGNGVPTAKPCPQTKKFSVLGVATLAVAAGETGNFTSRGPCLIQSTGAITAKQPIRVSATDGVVEAAGAFGTGEGREVIGMALSDASGGFVWANLKAR